MATRIRGDLTINNDATITENLTVDGTSTTLNTATLNVEDVNITVNDGGDQSAADGVAGLTVEMSDATDAKLLYDSSTTSKWKAGESGSEIEVATISASQVITNKDIDGGTASNSNRLTAPKASKSTLDGLTRKEATLVYASDESKLYVDDGTELQPVGSGGGGLDVLHTEDFESTNAADFVTGNNATPTGAGTGTLDGTLADETTDELNGDASLSYTAGSSSDDDYFLSPEITTYEKHTNNWLGFTFYYTYDGNDDDIRFVVWDETNDEELTYGTETLEASTTAARFSAAVYIPDGVTSIRYGWFVATGNNTSELIVDDVEISSNPFVYKELVDEIYVLGEGNGGTSLTANTTNIDWTEVTDSNGAWDGTTFTAPRDGQYTFTGSINTTASLSSGIDVYVNGTQEALVGNASSATVTPFATTLDLSKDDTVTFRFRTGATLSNSSNLHTIRITGQATTEHVVTPAQNSETETKILSADITATDSTISDLTFSNLKVGERYFVSGQFEVDYSVSDTAFFEFSHNSSVIHAIKLDSSDSTEGSTVNAAVAFFFTAEAASLTVGVTETGNISVKGNGTRSESYLQLTNVTAQFLAAVPVQQTAYIKDKKASGTAAGASSANTVQTRHLNTLEGDTSWVSLASNQFTLAPGKYEIEAKVPAFNVANHQAFLYNVTDASYDIDGVSMFCNAADNVNNMTTLEGPIDITSSKTYEIRHWTQSTKATNGLGVATNGTNNPQSNEVYTQVKVTKIK